MASILPSARTLPRLSAPLRQALCHRNCSTMTTSTIPQPKRATSPTARKQPTVPNCLFSTTPASQKQMPSRPKPPPDEELEESYLKGSGPGGQKINKTSSAVQLKHIPTGIVVKSQATRSRSQNRNIARQLLAERLDDLRNGDQSRAAIVGEIKRKRAASASKKSRRKYKKLEEEEEKEAGAPSEEAQDKSNIELIGQRGEASNQNTAGAGAERDSNQTEHQRATGQETMDHKPQHK